MDNNSKMQGVILTLSDGRALAFLGKAVVFPEDPPVKIVDVKFTAPLDLPINAHWEDLEVKSSEVEKKEEASVQKASELTALVSVSAEFERIDAMHRISEMLTALQLLDPSTREAVILEGLARSRFQHTWSYMAKNFGIDSSRWPPNPLVKAAVEKI